MGDVILMYMMLRVEHVKNIWVLGEDFDKWKRILSVEISSGNSQE